MDEITNDRESFIGYEYKEVTVSNDMESVYADAYTQFGWMLVGSEPAAIGLSTVFLKFRRNRKIRNKAELTRLQRQFESNAREIEKLEQSKTTTASIAAFSIGLAGTAFMAGSVFTLLAAMIPLCIILAIPALVGWVLPYFSFARLTAKRTEMISPLIDQQYDAICETCEKAHCLLA